MLSAHQIRAGRALLKWSARNLAERAGIHLTTVQRLERSTGPLRCSLETAERIKGSLEREGVVFIGLNGVELNGEPVGKSAD